MAKRRVNKAKIGKYLAGAGGGIFGNIASSAAEKYSPMIASNPNIAPALSALMGLGLTMLKGQTVKDFGYGQFVVASAELGQNAIDATGIMDMLPAMNRPSYGPTVNSSKNSTYNPVI